MRRSLFLVIVWGMMAGIFVRSFLFVSFSTEVFVFLISGALIVSSVFSQTVFSHSGENNVQDARKYAVTFICFVFLTSAALGMMRYSWFQSERGDARLSMHTGKNIEAEGIVVEEPEVKESYTKLIIAADALISKSGQEKIRPTKILVTDDPYSKRKYGDRIKVQGKLARPENRPSNEGRTFDYVSYLAKDRIFYEMKYVKISLVSENNGGFVKRNVLTIKNSFIKSLDKSLPYLEAKLGAGLIVAGKRALPKEIQNEFVRTGTVQVVVLSGYNVTLIAEALTAFLAFLPSAFGLGLSALIISLFALAAGGSATIIRAVTMVFIALLGKVVRRPYSPGRGLLAAAVMMLIVNPMLLVFDASFQLSFVATAGLIFGAPLIENRLKFFRDTSALKKILAATLATQLSVMPFIFYMTGSVSVVALPANILVSFLVPVTMFLSFLTGVLGLVSPVLGILTGFIAYVPLKLMLLIVHLFSSVPFAAVTVPF